MGDSDSAEVPIPFGYEGSTTDEDFAADFNNDASDANKKSEVETQPGKWIGRKAAVDEHGRRGKKSVVPGELEMAFFRRRMRSRGLEEGVGEEEGGEVGRAL